MKIMHCCLANFYIDNYGYQENILSQINKKDGHSVLIIASTETYLENNKIGYVKPSRYKTADGIPVVRLPYVKVFTKSITRKIRKYSGLYKEIEDFKPDVIMIHDLCFYSIKEIIKYKKRNPNVRLFADTHTAGYNSGKNWISLNFLHRIFYKHLILKAIPYIEKYFYIGRAEKKFNLKNYKVPEDKMEFLPLGGLVVDDHEYSSLRSCFRNKLGVNDNTFVLLHSGKMDKLKKTDILLNAFKRVNEMNALLLIIGSFPEDEKEYLKLIARDKRVVYLGWKDQTELRGYLCASDLYCQPGSPSATLQNAICCHVPVMAYPFEGYKDIDCGNFCWVENEEDIYSVFQRINNNQIDLNQLREKTMVCANEVLDYHKMARRIY